MAHPSHCNTCLKQFTTETGLKIHQKQSAQCTSHFCMQCWDDFQRIQGLAAREHALKTLPPEGVPIEPGFMINLLANEEGMMLDDVVNLPLPTPTYPDIGSGIDGLDEGAHLSD
jgi:hypothetical protein